MPCQLHIRVPTFKSEFLVASGQENPNPNRETIGGNESQQKKQLLKGGWR
jgi:hypothetical protein